MEITDQDSEASEKNETTSNARLFQPLSTQEECRVKTFDGDDRCQPIDHSGGRRKKIIQGFTQMIIHPRRQ